jgi:hypothetical protein
MERDAGDADLGGDELEAALDRQLGLMSAKGGPDPVAGGLAA